MVSSISAAATSLEPFTGQAVVSDDDVAKLPQGGRCTTDEERHRSLMAGIQGGDAECLQKLIESFSAPLLSYAAEIIANSDDAEDIVQETFVQLWLHRAEWSPSGSVSAYLYRITRNLSLNFLRRIRAREKWDKISGEELFHSVPPATGETIFEEEEINEEVEAAIATLPARRREIFMLCRFHGLTHREIAETLAISPQTVSNQMSTALSHLRLLLHHRLER
jgi:RNA polymerase sigma-70 factor, ECF subfamily